jgi:mRNA-degrading endonuclease RelE of RelBE toxin-antitoxin system
MEEMRTNPYGGDLQYLRGSNGGLRRRVGSWRIVFELHKDRHLIVILNIKRRSSNTY